MRLKWNIGTRIGKVFRRGLREAGGLGRDGNGDGGRGWVGGLW